MVHDLVLTAGFSENDVTDSKASLWFTFVLIFKVWTILEKIDSRFESSEFSWQPGAKLPLIVSTSFWIIVAAFARMMASSEKSLSLKHFVLFCWDPKLQCFYYLFVHLGGNKIL